MTETTGYQLSFFKWPQKNYLSQRVEGQRTWMFVPVSGLHSSSRPLAENACEVRRTTNKKEILTGSSLHFHGLDARRTPGYAMEHVCKSSAFHVSART
jgi:hypothetical protein